MYHNESRNKIRQRDVAIMIITTKRGRGAVSQRDSQQSEAGELVNNKSHSKARQESWATRCTTGHVRETGQPREPQQVTAEELYHKESRNKSRQRDWATTRATKMRFRGALSQRDAQHKARQRNWATKSLQGEAGELVMRATTSRGRGTGQP